MAGEHRQRYLLEVGAGSGHGDVPDARLAIVEGRHEVVREGVDHIHESAPVCQLLARVQETMRTAHRRGDPWVSEDNATSVDRRSVREAEIDEYGRIDVQHGV